MISASDIHKAMSLTESFFSEAKAKALKIDDLIRMDISSRIKAIDAMDIFEKRPRLRKLVFEGLAQLNQIERHGGRFGNKERAALLKVFPLKDVDAAYGKALQAYNKKIGYDPISMTMKKESKEAPYGAVVDFGGQTYKKGRTDQPTWIPTKKSSGLIGVIPSEDEENYDAIEKAFADAQSKSANRKMPLSPEMQKKVNALNLQIMKAPLAQKKALIDKLDALYAKASTAQESKTIEEKMTTGDVGVFNYQQMRGAKPNFKSRMKPDDEKKIAVLKAQLLKTPLAQKQKVMDQIRAIETRYESRAVNGISEAVINKKVPSKKVPGIVYELSNISGKRYLTIWWEATDSAIWQSVSAPVHRVTDFIKLADQILSGVDWTVGITDAKKDKDKYMDKIEKFRSKITRATDYPAKGKYIIKGQKNLADESTTPKGKWASLAESFFKKPELTKLVEGGPGSGGQYPTQKLKMPMSPYVSVGTRKGILKNMPFEIQDVDLSRITHVAQTKFVPFKVKRLCKNRDGITKKPVCLLYVPSEDCYHVMDGHHRFLAAQKLGIDQLPAKVWTRHEEPSAELTVASETDASETDVTQDEADDALSPEAAPSESMPLPEPEAAPTAPMDPSTDPSTEPSLGLAAELTSQPEVVEPSLPTASLPSEPLPEPLEEPLEAEEPEAAPAAMHEHFQMVCEKCETVTESCGCVNEEKVSKPTVCESCKANSFLVPTLEAALKSIASNGQALARLHEGARKSGSAHIPTDPLRTKHHAAKKRLDDLEKKWKTLVDKGESGDAVAAIRTQKAKAEKEVSELWAQIKKRAAKNK